MEKNSSRLKKSGGLLQRLIVISRSRPELNLEKCIGEFEFGLVPHALFAADGTLLLASDKYKIREQLERMMKVYQEKTEKGAGEGNVEKDDANVLEENTDDAIPSEQWLSSSKRVIIIDGMALLNSSDKVFQEANVFSQFANAFLEQLALLAKDYDQLRLVFDRYIDSSLKEQTRSKKNEKDSHCEIPCQRSYDNTAH